MVFRHQKYSDIENHYQQKMIQNIQLYTGKDEIWRVYEKVDGANFALYTDGTRVECASRNEMISGTAKDFFNHKIVMDKYSDTVRDIFLTLQASSHPGMRVMVFYGEIIGGSYKHIDVKQDDGISAVQKRVQYTSGRDWLLFDVTIDGVYQDETFVEQMPLARPPFIMEGTFDECLAVDEEFVTWVPIMYGHPKIENNWSEGVVIKPVKAQHLPSGHRVIVKKKSKSFAEREQKDHTEKKLNPVTPLSEKQAAYLNIGKEYINDNRFQSLVSKIGNEPARSEFNKNRSLYVGDVIKDFLNSHDDIRINLEDAERERVIKELSAAATIHFRDNYLKIAV